MAGCDECGGVVVDGRALRQSASGSEVAKIWRRIQLGKRAGLDCPMCGQEMLASLVDGIELDGCPREDVVWFDSAELTRFRSGLAPADTTRLADDGIPIPRGLGGFWVDLWP